MNKYILILAMIFSSYAMGAQVDNTKSEFVWTGAKLTGSHTGKLKVKQSSLSLNKKGLIKSGSIQIDMNSLTVTDISGGMAQKFIGHVKSKDFLEVGKFPTATLKINNDDGRQLSGVMTIKGKSHPVKVSYKKKQKVYSGQLKFDRTKYGMIYGSGSFFKNLGDKAIKNEVVLDFKVVIK
jgi:polyisoprenoid-binding protein YceI